MNNEVSIKLSDGSIAIVDAESARALPNISWYNEEGYAVGRKQVGGKTVSFRMHRLIIGAAQGEIVDHIDGDKLNNRRENLRIVDASQNVQNRPMFKSNKCGFKGVYWCAEKKKFRAVIRAYRKSYRLGWFSKAEDAYAAYVKASADLHGEYGRLK